jgi:outer membrane protein assembly factor BamB
MKKIRLIIIPLLIALFSLLLNACSGAASIPTGWPGLSTDGETAFLADNQSVYAINLNNGNEKWRYPAQPSVKISFYAPPALTPDGQLLVGGYDNVLRSLNPANGQENWTFTGADNRFINNPLITAQGIFAPTGGKHLYALDMKGNVKWSFATEGALWAQPIASPDGSTIYLPSMDHRLYAIDTQNGTLKWRTDKLNASIAGTPVLSDNGMLYVGTFASELVKIDPSTHKSISIVKTDGWVWGGPIFKGGMLYFGDLSGKFYVVDLANEKVVWSVQPDKGIVGSPLVTDTAVYFGTESGTLFAYDLKGNLSWNKPFSGSIYTTPLQIGDKILVALYKSDSLLAAMNSGGNMVWTFIPAKKQ